MQMKDRSDEWNEIMAQFAAEVHNLLDDKLKITIYYDMRGKDQMECYIAGVLLGMFGRIVELCHTIEAVEELEAYIHHWIPVARKIVNEWRQHGVDTEDEV